MAIWDTPWGKNVRYTVAFQRVFERVDSLGSARPLEQSVRCRVITPNGELTAVAIAAKWLAEKQPRLGWGKVVLAGIEQDFTYEPGDLRDDDSRAR